MNAYNSTVVGNLNLYKIQILTIVTKFRKDNDGGGDIDSQGITFVFYKCVISWVKQTLIIIYKNFSGGSAVKMWNHFGNSFPEQENYDRFALKYPLLHRWQLIDGNYISFSKENDFEKKLLCAIKHSEVIIESTNRENIKIAYD